jgi:hypothetical protein
MWSQIVHTTLSILADTLRFIEEHDGAIVAIFTVVLAISTILLWNATRNLGKDTRDSIKVAQKDFTATHRPWVSVDLAVASDLTYDTQGDAHIAINFTLKNTGHSPAANVSVEAAMFTPSQTRHDAIAAQNEMCGNVRKQAPTRGRLGHTIFPGDVFAVQLILPIPRKDIEAAIGHSEESKWFAPTLIGCVDYKFTFEDGHHQTGFYADLHKHAPNNPANMFNADEGSVPAAHIQLVHGFIGGYAD